MVELRAADIVKGAYMIRLTRLNRAPMVLNSDLIEHIDVTPDTVITLTTGQILRVRETADQVIGRIVEFRRRISAGSAGIFDGESGGDGKVENPASEVTEGIEQREVSDRFA